MSYYKSNLSVPEIIGKNKLKTELNWEINSFQREKNENEGESRYNEQQCFTTQTEATTPSINKKEEVRS